MIPLTKKLSYKNANKQIKKLSKIPCNISKNKWTEHKLNI